MGAQIQLHLQEHLHLLLFLHLHFSLQPHFELSSHLHFPTHRHLHSQLSLQSHITGLPLERKMDLLIRAVIKQRMKGYISDINQEVNVDLINST